MYLFFLWHMALLAMSYTNLDLKRCQRVTVVMVYRMKLDYGMMMEGGQLVKHSGILYIWSMTPIEMKLKCETEYLCIMHWS